MRRQDEDGLFGEMRAQQEAFGHDCDILRSDYLAEQLLDVLMNVAQMPAVDQDMPRRLESVQREASVGEMGSRYDPDIFLRKEGLLDHARVESGEASNGDVDLARFEPRDQLLASQRHGLEAHIRRHLPYPFEHARQHQQMADIRGRDVKVPVGGQRIEGGFTAQACAIELQCLRYGRRRRHGDRGRLESSPGPDEALIPEMVAELLERTEERRVGKECVRKGNYGWWA